MLSHVVVEVFRSLKEVGEKRVSRTKVMKLLYLIDRVCTEVYGEKCTGASWRLWWHGPFSREVLDVLDELEAQGIVESEVLEHDRGVAVLYSLKEDLGVKGIFDERLRSIIREVVVKWGRRSLDEILEYVYSLPEVRSSSLGDPL